MSTPEFRRWARSVRAAALTIALVCFGWALGACRPAAPRLSATETALPDFGLALRFPEGWEVHENDASLRLLARPLRDGKPVPGVWFIVARDRAREPRDGLPVSSASAMPSLASYVERRESLAQKDVLDYHVVADTRLTLDGIAAVRRERTYASYTRKLGACAVMAVRGRYGYELTGAAPASEYSRWQPVFAAIAGSLRWLPQPETADAPAPDR